jgi:hypothetical protein
MTLIKVPWEHGTNNEGQSVRAITGEPKKLKATTLVDILSFIWLVSELGSNGVMVCSITNSTTLKIFHDAH